MKITNITSGISYINASIPNVFVIDTVNTIKNTISITKSTASSLASVQNESSVSIAVEPGLKAPIYSSQL